MTALISIMHIPGYSLGNVVCFLGLDLIEKEN